MLDPSHVVFTLNSLCGPLALPVMIKALCAQGARLWDVDRQRAEFGVYETVSR
ncbi:MAG: hypothetical protein M3308_08185 [Actinomycetota bacterium]|nr:hypothetical protein [Actinomycetota bacterium]